MSQVTAALVDEDDRADASYISPCSCDCGSTAFHISWMRFGLAGQGLHITCAGCGSPGIPPGPVMNGPH